MSRLVCLANSARPGGQCIAGIDLDTREWVRPVPRDGDAVPIERCVIDNKFLSTLDIIQIQQEFVRPAEIPRFQRENRFIDDWNWSIVGRLRAADLLDLCDETSPLFHGTGDRVSPAAIERLSPSRWASLQLVKPRRLRFACEPSDKYRWRARFADAAANEYSLRITDVNTLRRLSGGVRLSPRSLLTVSLSKPWSPADGSKPAMCYKLVAAVIELE